MIGKGDHMKRNLFRKLLLVYCIFLFVFVVVKFNGSVYEILDRVTATSADRVNGVFNFNLIPFRSIGVQLARITHWWALKNILGNIALFVPLGVLIPMAFPTMQKSYKTCSTILLSSLVIELFQFITCLGSFDIDDIILNSVGGLIGYIIFYLLKKKSIQRNANRPTA